jgi:hypothetical protein
LRRSNPAFLCSPLDCFADRAALCADPLARNDGGAFPEIGWREAARFARFADMKASAKNISRPATSAIARRVEAIDWMRISADLDAQGCAVIEQLLPPQQCAALAALYPDDTRFRSRVVMGRHGFGRGEYKYFSYPLPDLIAELRPALYAPLQGVANRWNEAMGIAAAIRTATELS